MEFEAAYYNRQTPALVGHPDCQDGVYSPTTCYVANLESALPFGTLYSSATVEDATTKGSAFVNNLATWTTPGHTMLLTGVRDVEPNREPSTGVPLDLRPFRPTLFERLRKQLGWSQDEAAMVVSKPNLEQLDYSFDPAHGSAYAARLYATEPHQPGAGEDVDVATGGRCLMRALQPDKVGGQIVGCTTTPVAKPKFLFLHFGGVDAQGHDCPTDAACAGYTEAIQQVDSEIYTKIWGELCDLPTSALCQVAGKNPDFRRNNTAIVITTDHGRESFSVKLHGGLDWANRSIFLWGSARASRR